MPLQNIEFSNTLTELCWTGISDKLTLLLLDLHPRNIFLFLCIWSNNTPLHFTTPTPFFQCSHLILNTYLPIIKLIQRSLVFHPAAGSQMTRRLLCSPTDTIYTRRHWNKVYWISEATQTSLSLDHMDSILQQGGQRQRLTCMPRGAQPSLIA